MATGSIFAAVANKVVMGLDKIVTYGTEPMLAEIRKWIALMAGGSGYWFDMTPNGTVDYVGLDITAVDKIGVESGRYGVTTSGKILLTNTLGTTSSKFPFPNAAATTYYVYARSEKVPTLVERATDGYYRATRETEYIGFKGTPASVSDQGDGTISMIVNNVTGTDNHAGRKVRVWKNTFHTSVTATAFEECTVTWNGSANVIETTGKFGQSTISETSSDYSIMLIGPMIRTTTYSSDEALLIGTVVGGGAGLVPASKSTATQPIHHVWWSALSKVLRYDTHGEPKVRVLVDSSDSEEPQIEVYNSTAGAATFGVDEDGDMKIGRSGGGTIRSLTFYTDSSKTVGLTADDGDLFLASHNDAHVIEIDGVEVVPPTGHGNRGLVTTVPSQEDNGTAVASIVTALNSFSACDDLEAGGAIDWVYGETGNTDPVPTITGAGGADVTVGAFAYRARHGLGWCPEQTITPANGTTYLVVAIGSTGGAQQATELVSSTATALTHVSMKGNYLLGKVVKSAGVISSITRLARPYRMLNTNRDITVGPFDAGGDFETLKEAVDYVNNVSSCLGSSSPRRWTIRVIGSTVEANPVVISAAGVTIIGSCPIEITEAIYVTWTHTGNCIEVSASSDVTIQNLALLYENASDGGAGIALTNALLSYNMKFEGIRVASLGSGGNPLYGISLGTSDDVSYIRIRDCHLLADQYGVVRSTGDEIANVWIEDNFLYDNGAAAGGSGIILAADVQGKALHVRNNRITGFMNGIVISKSIAFVRDNELDGFYNDGIQVLYSESAGTVVDGNYARGSGGSEATSYGIAVAAPRVRVCNNDTMGSTSATTKYGIRVDASPTDYCILTGNQTNGQTLSNANGADTTETGNRDDA